MPTDRKLTVIKVPLTDKERQPDYPQIFPRLPRLYLELIENKAKIKQDLINKEYVPKERPPEQQPKPEFNYGGQEIGKQENKDQNRYNDKEGDLDDRDRGRDDRDRGHDDRDHGHDDRDRNDQRNHVNKDKYGDMTEIKEKFSGGDSREDIRYDSRSYDSSHDSHSYDSRSYDSSRRSSYESYDSRRSGNEIDEKYDKRSEVSDDLSVRLKELLEDSVDSRSEYSNYSRKDKYSRQHKKTAESRSIRVTSYDRYKKERKVDQEPTYAPPVQAQEPAPTLAELEAKGHYQRKEQLRDINHIPVSEVESEDQKRKLLFQFDILKKSYPSSVNIIPQYTIHSNLHEMTKAYEDTVKRVSIDSSVETYKSYLFNGFLVVEWVFGSFLGFDMKGFTQQQIVNSGSYDQLLVELGEKSYVPSGSKWPVELRLLFTIVLNAGVFIVGKMIMKNTGANLLNMMNKASGSNSPPVQPGTSAPTKRKMRGPTIDLNDLPEATNETNTQPAQQATA